MILTKGFSEKPWMPSDVFLQVFSNAYHIHANHCGDLLVIASILSRIRREVLYVAEDVVKYLSWGSLEILG